MKLKRNCCIGEAEALLKERCVESKVRDNEIYKETIRVERCRLQSKEKTNEYVGNKMN